ncbi:hypothetical protein GW17_00058691 [Ensete ventricosum]|nr:hypothetical protein GW17_00058691 [Ensete ventricosum]RZR88140.1 hypothetical protein BHM03_00015660 [Ensete ventricosum]
MFYVTVGMECDTPVSLLCIGSWYACHHLLCFMNSRQSESYTKASEMPPPKEGAESEGEDKEDMEEHGNTLCGACGDNYANDEFWICCDVCEKWYHGKCVKITPARAEHIKQYKCPGCSTKRTRA